MAETTQEERRNLRSDIYHKRYLHPLMVAKVINDADRLARLEDGIRALADKYLVVDTEQPGAVVRADTFESELRDLLDGECAGRTAVVGSAPGCEGCARMARAKILSQARDAGGAARQYRIHPLPTRRWKP